MVRCSWWTIRYLRCLSLGSQIDDNTGTRPGEKGEILPATNRSDKTSISAFLGQRGCVLASKTGKPQSGISADCIALH
jgi:hypothetical protein